MAEWVDDLIRKLCAGRGWDVEALEGKIDDVHLILSCPPRDAPAKVMNVLTSITARERYDEFPRLRRSHWGERLWAKGYYVGSAGDHVASNVIEQYIEYQETEDTEENWLF